MKLQHLFGYRNAPPYLEFSIMHVVLHLVSAVCLSVLFAHMVGEMSYFIDPILESLIYGFTVAGVSINPLQLLLGLVMFCLLSLLSRYISTGITHRQQLKEDEEETQVALASIVLYAGVGLSVLLGLLFAGVNITSITIMAGALSVGIGLGLQSIINNFVSGLILLIEKPIKTGDRIEVDGVEGFVKKIRVRSTQIVTPAKEDIIIPNSDLITRQVTNYMFSNKYWRVQTNIGVAYGSDIDLVSEVLMNIAITHPEVIKGQRAKPRVLFRSFGDSALLFELWCFIKDVNKKYSVQSELNFAIDKAFKEHNITIAFPQQDVHVTFDKKNIPWESKDE